MKSLDRLQNKIMVERAKATRKNYKYNRSVWRLGVEGVDGNVLRIYTTCPGLWIGLHGKGIETLKEELNKVVTEALEHLTEHYESMTDENGNSLTVPEVTKKHYEDCIIEEIKIVECEG